MRSRPRSASPRACARSGSRGRDTSTSGWTGVRSWRDAVVAYGRLSPTRKVVVEHTNSTRTRPRTSVIYARRPRDVPFAPSALGYRVEVEIHRRHGRSTADVSPDFSPEESVRRARPADHRGEPLPGEAPRPRVRLPRGTCMPRSGDIRARPETLACGRGPRAIEEERASRPNRFRGRRGGRLFFAPRLDGAPRVATPAPARERILKRTSGTGASRAPAIGALRSRRKGGTRAAGSSA